MKSEKAQAGGVALLSLPAGGLGSRHLGEVQSPRPRCTSERWGICAAPHGHAERRRSNVCRMGEAFMIDVGDTKDGVDDLA